MFEPDEYLFTKLAHFFKLKKKKAENSNTTAVLLHEIKPKLTILARAFTGDAIELFEAEREGGYKNNNFFLPKRFAEFETIEENVSYYLFRVLYLSVQKSLKLNYIPTDQKEGLELARQKAQNNSTDLLKDLFSNYPVSKEIYQKLKTHYNTKKEPDFTFIYGKWMKNEIETKKEEQLQNISDKVKKAIQDEIKTVIKAGAVEEINSVTVDKKAQEDYVLNHSFEKVETAEEYDGGWRDFDGDDELEDHANALEDLNMKHTVRVDDMTHSVYQTDFIENTTVLESISTNVKDYHVTYDEWDYKKRVYKPDFCKLYPINQKNTTPNYTKKTLRENRQLLNDLRKMLANVNNKFKQKRKQNQGDEYDLDALTDLFVDIHSKHTPSENIYLNKQKREKDLSILLLLDISLSTDGYAAGNKVIDVEKQVSIVFGEILNEYNVDFSIDCFYSKTRNHSTYLNLKGFDEDWSKTKHRIGAVEPAGYTRIGTALRHSGTLLDKRDSKNKWIILLSDGKPNDYDKYEGKYGVNDVKQALRELNQRNINSYALAIEAEAKYYLPQMFGQKHFQILTTPNELLESLVQLYTKIKQQN